MKLFIKFTNKPDAKSPFNVKVLGEAWEENQDFHIVINKDGYFDNIETLIEESAHIFIRVLCSLTGNRITLKNEHNFIRDLIALFRKYKIIS